MDAIRRRYRASAEAADWRALLQSDEISRNEPHVSRPETAVKRSRGGLWLSPLAAGVVVLLCAGLLLLPVIRGQVIATDRGGR